MKKIRLPFVLFLLIILSINITAYGQDLTNSKPNVLLILVDDLGYGDLSCMGAEDLETPNIDGIIEGGMQFNQFYANCPVCSPSRASLLTGRYPDLVGVPGVIRQWDDNSWGYMDPEAVLIPELMNEAGYNTAMVGKWHLGLENPNTPNDRGFQFFKGFLADMMDDYYTHLRGDINWMRLNEKEIDPEGHATDLFSDWSIDYINEQKNSENPFFLYLAYNAPHDPIHPPEDWLNKVKEREEGITEERAGLVALIEHLDYGVGKVMDALEKNDLLENTIVIFTSDNGGSLYRKADNGPLRGGKQDMYEGGIRVPAGIYWKNKIKPQTTNNFAMLMDLFPTILELAGSKYEHEVDGISILPLLEGREQVTDDRYVYWVRREGNRYKGRVYYAARHRDLKLVQNTPFEPYQYFNIEKDMKEEHPLPEEENENIRKLWRSLQNHILEAGAVPWKKK